MNHCIVCDDSLIAQLTSLSVTEMLSKKESYNDTMSSANILASHFIRLGLPLMERLLSIEPQFMAHNVFPLSFKGIRNGIHYSDARQLIRKVIIFHQLFTALDVWIFPQTIAAHTNGCKVGLLIHSFVHVSVVPIRTIYFMFHVVGHRSESFG
jgi:hypothetical protein